MKNNPRNRSQAMEGVFASLRGDGGDGISKSLPDGFRLLKRLGTGSSASVFLVEKDGKKFALKLFRSGEEERFANEANVLKKVQAPGVVRIAGSGVTSSESRPYVLMELVPGKTLEDVMKEGRMGMNEKLSVFLQTAEILSSIHKNGVLHLDVKPANVFVDKDLRVTLGDFSIAREKGASCKGRVSGSPAYMAPEAFDESGSLDERADVFSLGVLAYELITGIKPFHGETVEEMRNEVRNRKPVRPRKLVCRLPSGIEYLLEKMLAKDPARRLSSAGEVAETINEIMKNGKTASKQSFLFFRKILSSMKTWS